MLEPLLHGPTKWSIPRHKCILISAARQPVVIRVALMPRTASSASVLVTLTSHYHHHCRHHYYNDYSHTSACVQWVGLLHESQTTLLNYRLAAQSCNEANTPLVFREATFEARCRGAQVNSLVAFAPTVTAAAASVVVGVAVALADASTN